MRYLYYCNSTYQLLNVLNLHHHRNAGFEDIPEYRADLLLLNASAGADEIIKILNEEKTFDRANLIEKTYNKGAFHTVKTLLDALSPSYYMRDKYGNTLKDMRDRYDVICVPKYSTIVDQIWQLNQNAALELFEEGLGSYHLDFPLEPRSRMYQTVRSFAHRKDFHDYRRIYVINKDLYMADHEERVVQMPPFDQKYLEHLRDRMKEFDQVRDENRKIFWLSQFLDNEEYNRMVDTVLQGLLPYKENVLFVQHPRKYVENRYDFKEADRKQIWELQLLNMKDLDEKLLISIHSTACFSAKMLFDREPYVILFYKLGDPEVAHITEEFEAIVAKFRDSYRDPKKIMIPENMEEYHECLRRYAEAVLNR